MKEGFIYFVYDKDLAHIKMGRTSDDKGLLGRYRTILFQPEIYSFNVIDQYDAEEYLHYIAKEYHLARELFKITKEQSYKLCKETQIVYKNTIEIVNVYDNIKTITKKFKKPEIKDEYKIPKLDDYRVEETTQQILDRKERIKKKYVLSHIKENNEKIIEKYISEIDIEVFNNQIFLKYVNDIYHKMCNLFKTYILDDDVDFNIYYDVQIFIFLANNQKIKKQIIEKQILTEKIYKQAGLLYKGDNMREYLHKLKKLSKLPIFIEIIKDDNLFDEFKKLIINILNLASRYVSQNINFHINISRLFYNLNINASNLDNTTFQKDIFSGLNINVYKSLYNNTPKYISGNTISKEGDTNTNKCNLLKYITKNFYNYITITERKTIRDDKKILNIYNISFESVVGKNELNIFKIIK